MVSKSLETYVQECVAYIQEHRLTKEAKKKLQECSITAAVLVRVWCKKVETQAPTPAREAGGSTALFVPTPRRRTQPAKRRARSAPAE